MSFLRTYFQRNKWRNWRDGIMNIKGRNNKEQKDAHIIRQHITRQTRDFFTTFNKTLSTMYAFFYSNTLKVTYIRVVYMYIYVIRRCHIPRNILTLLNLRLSLSFSLVSSIFEKMRFRYHCTLTTNVTILGTNQRRWTQCKTRK